MIFKQSLVYPDTIFVIINIEFFWPGSSLSGEYPRKNSFQP